MILYDFLKQYENEIMMSEEFSPYLKHGLQNILRHRPSNNTPKTLLIIQNVECVDIVEEFETINIFFETQVFMVELDEITPPHLHDVTPKYTIESVPWQELLGLQVLGDYLEDLSAIRTLLREACLFGNTELTWAINVARQHIDIEKAIKAFREDPDAKTYTMEEVMEELFKEFPEHREPWEKSNKIFQNLKREYKEAVNEACKKNEKRLQNILTDFLRGDE